MVHSFSERCDVFFFFLLLLLFFLAHSYHFVTDAPIATKEFSDKNPVWKIKPEYLAEYDGDWDSDKAIANMDMDRAVIPIDLQQHGVIEAILKVMGGSAATCDAPDPLVTRFGKDTRLLGCWQLFKRVAAGVIMVKSPLSLQEKIVQKLAPHHVVVNKPHKALKGRVTKYFYYYYLSMSIDFFFLLSFVIFFFSFF